MKNILVYLLVFALLLPALLLPALLLTACGGTEGETEGAGSESITQGSEGASESASDETSTDGSESTAESETEEGEAQAPEFDYETFDFKPYITLDASEYHGKTVHIPYDEVMPESYYEKQLNGLLSQYATDIKVTDQPVKKSDTVNIYYQGVTVGADGKETAFSGGTYREFGKPYALTIGSGKFIDGFEDGLIGVIPSDTLRTRSEGVIADGDVALVSCTYTTKSLSTGKESTSTDENIYFDFSGDTLLADLKTALLGKEVGGVYTVKTQKDADKDGTPESEDTYVVTVHSLLDMSTPASVSATFPNPYPNSPELAGKTVKFYVWVESIDGEELPEYNETFVLETLQFKTEESDVLAAFEREFRAEVLQVYESECKAAAIAEISDHLREVIVFKSLPETALAYERARLKEEAEYYYNYYKNAGYQLGSIEDFIISYYSVADAGTDFSADAWYDETAAQTLRENAIYFYLCDVLAVTVTEAEVTDAVNEFLDLMIESAKQSEGKTYTREEIYQRCVSYYGEGYIEMYYRDSIREERLNDTLLKAINVVYDGYVAE